MKSVQKKIVGLLKTSSRTGDSDSARGGWRDAEYKKIVGEEGI